jgi:hypothetical protein
MTVKQLLDLLNRFPDGKRVEFVDRHGTTNDVNVVLIDNEIYAIRNGQNYENSSTINQ